MADAHTRQIKLCRGVQWEDSSHSTPEVWHLACQLDIVACEVGSENESQGI